MLTKFRITHLDEKGKEIDWLNVASVDEDEGVAIVSLREISDTAGALWVAGGHTIKIEEK